MGGPGCSRPDGWCGQSRERLAGVKWGRKGQRETESCVSHSLRAQKTFPLIPGVLRTEAWGSGSGWTHPGNLGRGENSPSAISAPRESAGALRHRGEARQNGSRASSVSWLRSLAHAP